MQLSSPTIEIPLFAIIFIIQLSGTNQWKGLGTTPNLENIVIGRCYDYIETVNPSVGKKNCSAIWEAFKSAFISKDPCSVFPSDYEHYINLTLHDIPMNKSLFWENNKQLVHRFSDRGKRSMPLGDTLMGFLADNVIFCGAANHSGFDYNSCPTTSECEHNADESFWRLASVTCLRFLKTEAPPQGSLLENASMCPADRVTPPYQMAVISISAGTTELALFLWRTSPFPVEDQSFSNKDVLLWMKDFVHDAFKQFKQSEAKDNEAENSQSELRPRAISERVESSPRESDMIDEYRIIEDINSSESKDSDQELNLFPLQKMLKLFTFLEPEAVLQAEIINDDGIPKKSRAFKVDPIGEEAYG